MRVVLASASPRRKELLTALVGEFEVRAFTTPEELTDDGGADARRIAREKANAAVVALPGPLVIAADTVVHLAGRTFGKPEDAADAGRMLRELVGRVHTVSTGVAVAVDGRVEVEASEATVELAPLSEDAIRGYVASGRPLDKAGAYAIQDEDVPTVARLDGCFCCVMGLPLWRLRSMLLRAGVECPTPDETFARCAGCPERPGSACRDGARERDAVG